MSLVGLVNLAERLLNQNPAQGQDAQAAQKSANHPGNQESREVAEDQFIPSTQSGQGQSSAKDAGLFSVSQLSFFSAAADFLLGQSTTSSTNLPAAGPNTTNANSPAQQTASSSATSTPSSASLLQTASPGLAGANSADAFNTQPAVSATLATPVTTTAQSSAGSALTQQQLQTLNQALAALGLSPQDIQKLDRIATIINDFNPSEYTALAYQLEELAQLTVQQAAATAGGNKQPATNNTNATAASGAAANGGGFQVQELLIKFSGVEAHGSAQSNTGASGSAQDAAGNVNGNFQISAFNLQIEEVNLTLVNGNGQTAQIQAPLQTGNTNSAGANQAALNTRVQIAGA